MIKVRCSLTRTATGSELAMSVFVYWPKRPQAMLHLCVIGLLGHHHLVHSLQGTQTQEHS